MVDIFFNGAIGEIESFLFLKEESLKNGLILETGKCKSGVVKIVILKIGQLVVVSDNLFLLKIAVDGIELLEMLGIVYLEQIVQKDLEFLLFRIRNLIDLLLKGRVLVVIK